MISARERGMDSLHSLVQPVVQVIGQRVGEVRISKWIRQRVLTLKTNHRAGGSSL